MNKLKRVLPLSLSAVMLAATPMAAIASSPEFARTEEEWAKLRDNTIQYDELEDLIQEYNVTVQNNQLDYNEFRREYGTTKDDVSSKYREMAQAVYDSLSDDEDDPTSSYSALMADVQAQGLQKQADDNLEDSEIVYLNYKQAEKTLAMSAQSNMVNYEKNQLALTQAEIAKRQAEISLASTQAQAANGSATQVEVLTAQEALQTAQRNIESAKSDIENVKQKLLVMLGWNYNDAPEIEKVPAADMSRIETMNPYGDQEAAKENNYTLKVNQKKYANATQTVSKTTLEKTIADNEKKIGSSLVTAYQNVQAAKLAYDQAAAELELEKRNLQGLEAKFSQGQVSRNQLENQRLTVQNKQIALQLADLNLLQAIESYNWSVNGLASTS